MNTTITHYHIFCGSGGGALGFNAGQARIGKHQALFKCLGGIDVDPSACRNFSRFVGVEAKCLDLFSREQYEKFHGHAPPADWNEALPEHLPAEAPNILFLSAPCKGYSSLLSADKSASEKYQALNQLALRGILLALTRWESNPPDLILFENVPRIAQRGEKLLNQIEGLLKSHGYAVRRTVHDAGEIGGLSQHRKRFLLVARHMEKIPAFLYEPQKKSVRGIGEVLAKLPPPNGVGLHAMPKLSWTTWLRLALIPAGKDWRALQTMDLGRFGLEKYGDHSGKMRVEDWQKPAHTITGSDRVGSGALSIADVRWGNYRAYGVLDQDQASGTITAQAAPGSGKFSLADKHWHKDVLGVIKLESPIGTVTGQPGAMNGAFSVAAMVPGRFNNIYRLIEWNEPSACITGGGAPGGGGLSVADPRWANAGHYGVLPWTQPAGTVTGSGNYDNGRNSVADPRINIDYPIIIALDNTWHRPLTTLELAALQSFPIGLEWDGKSHSAWREQIGNAVPPGS